MMYLKLTKAKRREWLWSVIFILPLTTGLILFMVYPLITGIAYSFTDYNLFDMKFVGGVNYVQVFHDATFWKSFLNVIIFSINVPVNLVLALVISAILNSAIKGSKVYRAIYFLPIICGAVATTFIWKWIYASQYGLLDNILYSMGIQSPPIWLDVNQPFSFMSSMIIMTLWACLGTNILIYSATLKNIPTTYYEAALIDGANAFTRFFKITVPLISPITFYLLLTNLIGSLQEFSKFKIMVGYTDNTVLPVWYIYNFMGNFGYEYGYASALGVVYGLFLLGVAAINFILQKYWVSYDN